MASPRTSEEERLLDESLKLKPSRAIDRLLSEHPLDRVQKLYGQLQERIKRNTSELRLTLTQKYDHLIDCSNLLDSIKGFTDQIQEVHSHLSLAYHAPTHALPPTLSTPSPLLRIETLLHRRHFLSAMRETVTREQ
jgi:hypothetical protein